MDTLWPDDEIIPTDRGGLLARLGGQQLYFVSDTLLEVQPDILAHFRPIITRYIIDNAGELSVDILSSNFKDIINSRPLMVGDKLDRVLRWLTKQTDHQVAYVNLKAADGNTKPFELFRAAGLYDMGELRPLLKFAESQGWLSIRESMSGISGVDLSIEGIMLIEQRVQEEDSSRTVFVAMWFSSEMDEAFSVGIEPAITKNGYLAVRVDRREHNNKIDDEIIAEIRRSRFVISDFSCGDDGARGGVYFEAGFALALGKPVIFTVRESDLDKVHFDTRQFNHIVWDDPQELEAKLSNRIGATIGVFEG